MNVTKKVSIDLTQKQNVPSVDAVQNDSNSRKVEIHLFSGGEPWTIPSGLVASVSYSKPDGTTGWYNRLSNVSANACSYSENVVTAVLDVEMLTVAGEVHMSVVLQDSSTLDRIATFPINVNVSPDPSDKESISNNYYNYKTIDDMNAALDGFDEEIDEFRGSLRPFPWTVTPDNMEVYGWDTFLDLDHSYFYRVGYQVPESFGLPVVGKNGVLVPFYAGNRNGESRDWPTMYLCGYPDGQTGQYYIAHVGSAATLADVHWQKIAIDPDKFWVAINALKNAGSFLSYGEVAVSVDTVANTVTVPNGFVYTRSERIATPAATVERDTTGAMSFLVYDRGDGAVKSIPAASLEDDQVLIAILSRDHPGNENANLVPGKWSVDGVVYPKVCQVDETLSVSGAAADAAKVGEQLQTLKGYMYGVEKIVRFLTDDGVTLAVDTAKGIVTVSEGYIFYKAARIPVDKTTVSLLDSTVHNVIVYDTGSSGVRCIPITEFDGATMYIIAILWKGYLTDPSANCVPGNWSVDGVVVGEPEEVEAVPDKVYVSTDGSDSNSGENGKPFRTIGKAITSGAKTIFVLAGTYKEPINVSRSGGELEIIAKPLSYANKDVVIDLGTELIMVADSGTGLVKAAFVSTADDLMYKAFVTQTEALIYADSFISDGYACNLWSGDTKLVPVLSLEECQSTEGTWFYDGSNIYANGDPGTYVLSDGENQYGIYLEYLGKVKLMGITVKHAREDAVRLKGCSDAQISRCAFGYSGLYNGLALENTSAVVRNCEAMFNRTDGLNIHGVGTADFIDCVSHDNGDDGISHHDRSDGMIIGGEYYNNVKGGVCSPTFGSRNSVNGAYIHHNGHGVYAVTSEDGDYPTCTVSNCAIVDNTVGIHTNRYTLNCWNNVLSGNVTDTKAENGGMINIIG